MDVRMTVVGEAITRSAIVVGSTRRADNTKSSYWRACPVGLEGVRRPAFDDALTRRARFVTGAVLVEVFRGEDVRFVDFGDRFGMRIPPGIACQVPKALQVYINELWFWLTGRADYKYC